MMNLFDDQTGVILSLMSKRKEAMFYPDGLEHRVKIKVSDTLMVRAREISGIPDERGWSRAVIRMMFCDKSEVISDVELVKRIDELSMVLFGGINRQASAQAAVINYVMNNLNRDATGDDKCASCRLDPRYEEGRT